MRLARYLSLLGVLALAVACGGPAGGDATSTAAQAMRTQSFQQPAGTVAVNFVVDDHLNRVYRDGDLRWKGSFLLDAATRVLTFDPNWSGAADGAPARSGWPLLYDDGPWNRGGHEPLGARAGDHVWGVAVFVAPPAAGSQDFQYGLIDDSYEAALGNGWMWKGNNGSFTVEAGATAAVTAPGMAFPRFGCNDLVLRLEAAKLAQFPGWTWDLTTVTVKSSAWGWGEIAMRNLGHGQYLFLLSPLVGPGKTLPHTGLLAPGDVAEFVFVLGGVEYRNWWVDYLVLKDGVSAATMNWCTFHYATATVEVLGDGNTAVTVPQGPCH